MPERHPKKWTASGLFPSERGVRAQGPGRLFLFRGDRPAEGWPQPRERRSRDPRAEGARKPGEQAPQGKIIAASAPRIWRVSSDVHLASTVPDARAPSEGLVVVSSGGVVASKNATYGERSRAACGDPLREPGIRRTARSSEPSRRGTAARAQRAVMPTYGEASNGARSESEANAERVSPLRGGETSA